MLLHDSIATLGNTFVQFGTFFGVFAIAAVILSLLSRWTNNTFNQFLFPRFGMFAFGIIGVPVHEFCHAFFCKLFLHEVGKVKWFDPKARGGSHGSVTHYYNPWNLYHRIGHFFIGLGPVILAPVLLSLLFYLLVPGAKGFSAFAAVSPVALTKSFAGAVFAKANFTSFGFFAFSYLAISISSQMELSKEDLQQARQGLLPILLVLLVVNFVASLFGADWHGLALQISMRALTFWSCIFGFATCSAAFNLLVCSLLMSLVNKLCGYSPINPFNSR